MNIIEVDVFDFTVYVANGYAFNKFVKEVCKITKLKPESFERSPLAVYHFWRNDFSTDLHKICFLYSENKIKSNSPKNLSAIVHEVTHIKNVIFAHRGITSETGKDEHEACLNEFLMKKILECLN